MLSKKPTQHVPHARFKAQQMADEAYAHRLGELKMSAHDESEQPDDLCRIESSTDFLFCPTAG